MGRYPSYIDCGWIEVEIAVCNLTSYRSWTHGNWIGMDCDRSGWIVTDQDGLWQIEMDCDRSRWIVIDQDGLWQIRMDCDRSRWIVIDQDGLRQIGMDCDCKCMQLRITTLDWKLQGYDSPKEVKKTSIWKRQLWSLFGTENTLLLAILKSRFLVSLAQIVISKITCKNLVRKNIILCD